MFRYGEEEKTSGESLRSTKMQRRRKEGRKEDRGREGPRLAAAVTGLLLSFAAAAAAAAALITVRNRCSAAAATGNPGVKFIISIYEDDSNKEIQMLIDVERFEIKRMKMVKDFSQSAGFEPARGDPIRFRV